MCSIIILTWRCGYYEYVRNERCTGAPRPMCFLTGEAEVVRVAAGETCASCFREYMARREVERAAIRAERQEAESSES